MMTIAREIQALPAAAKMIPGYKSATRQGGGAPFALIPFEADLRIDQGAIIEMDFGDFALEVPPLIGIHDDAHGVKLVVIAGVRAGADVLLVVIKRHRLPRARHDEMMPLTIAKVLRLRGW